MKSYRFRRIQSSKSFYSVLRLIAIFMIFATMNTVWGQTQNGSSDQNKDSKLLDDYLKSKGYLASIVFDASNIKQFWTDLSVFAQDDQIHVLLPEETKDQRISKPMKIQLANVSETQECTVDVVSSSDAFDIEVLDMNLTPISQKSLNETFVEKKIKTTKFDLIDTDSFSFHLRFKSKKDEKISIDKLYLSFADKKDYTRMMISVKDLEAASCKCEQIDDHSFSVTGKRSSLLTSEFIPVSSKTVASSMVIKNIGETQTMIYVGYMVYNKDKIHLNGKNYPYNKNNKTLTVISANEGDEKIIVNTNGSESIWRKEGGCFLALNAKDDLSDVPSVDLLGETIKDIRPLANGEAEIILNKPLSKEVKKGSSIRIHGINGPQLYYKTQVLEPGEELILSNHIRKDENNLGFSIKNGFSRKVELFKLLIYSYSVDSKQENTILIRDYTVTH